jgi:hypothetical protein
MAETTDEPYVTTAGRVLTDDELRKLADEAEAGYDVSHLDNDEARAAGAARAAARRKPVTGGGFPLYVAAPLALLPAGVCYLLSVIFG